MCFGPVVTNDDVVGLRNCTARVLLVVDVNDFYGGVFFVSVFLRYR